MLDAIRSANTADNMHVRKARSVRQCSQKYNTNTTSCLTHHDMPTNPILNCKRKTPAIYGPSVYGSGTGGSVYGRPVYGSVYGPPDIQITSQKDTPYTGGPYTGPISPYMEQPVYGRSVYGLRIWLGPYMGDPYTDPYMAPSVYGGSIYGWIHIRMDPYTGDPYTCMVARGKNL